MDTNLNNNMKIGFFYQAGHMDNNILSTYMALKQLRKIYPENSVAFYEDESNNLKKIAIEFNCDYKKIPESENLFAKRMPVVNLDTGLKWLNRVYEAWKTTYGSKKKSKIFQNLTLLDQVDMDGAKSCMVF